MLLDNLYTGVSFSLRGRRTKAVAGESKNSYVKCEESAQRDRWNQVGTHTRSQRKRSALYPHFAHEISLSLLPPLFTPAKQATCLSKTKANIPQTITNPNWIEKRISRNYSAYNRCTDVNTDFSGTRNNCVWVGGGGGVLLTQCASGRTHGHKQRSTVTFLDDWMTGMTVLQVFHLKEHAYVVCFPPLNQNNSRNSVVNITKGFTDRELPEWH